MPQAHPLNGYVLSTPSQEKLIGGCCSLSTLNCLIGCWSILPPEFQLGPNKRVLLVLDQAGWHQSQDLVIPEGIDLFELPSHSPELQLFRRLWPLTNEVVANCSPQNLDELEELLVYRCQQLLGQQDLIRGLTCFHWWPRTRQPLTIT